MGGEHAAAAAATMGREVRPANGGAGIGCAEGCGGAAECGALLMILTKSNAPIVLLSPVAGLLVAGDGDSRGKNCAGHKRFSPKRSSDNNG